MSATTSGASRAPARPGDDDTRSTDDPHSPSRWAWVGRWIDRLGPVVVVGAVAVGVALRFVQESDLWLDEALTVNIARLPLGEIGDALRQDGHPPLFYVLLHGWMQLVGEGDAAVRALAGIISVATLPLAWIAGRRIGGRPMAVAALVLVACSPYAIRYGSETRMYSLVMLLVFAGWLMLDDARRDPRPLRLVGLALISGALLWSHYWSLWLLAATGLLLLWQAWRGQGEERGRALRCALAVAAGGVLFLPWLPTFLHQAQHTGTPWAGPLRPSAAIALTLEDFGGGDFLEAGLLASVLLVLVLLGVFGRAEDGRRVQIDLRTVPTVRFEALAVVLTLALAMLASYATGSTYVTRYAAVFFPVFALVTAAGLACFVGRGGRAVAYLTVIGLGLVCGAAIAFSQPRTQAGALAAEISATAQPGDVVVYCPDQLGPAVDRLLPDGLVGLGYPSLDDPAFVDWEDYADRNAAADPDAIAAEVLEQAGPDAQVFLVASGDYETYEGQCEALGAALATARPGGGTVVAEDGDEFFEHGGLQRFPAAG